jgi:hypothetical protein
VNIIDAPESFRPTLGFAVDVIDAAVRADADTIPAAVVTACRSAVDAAGGAWWGCDNATDILIETCVPIRDINRYIQHRDDAGTPDGTGPARERWADVDDRLDALSDALAYAARTAEDAGSSVFGVLFGDWIRNRVAALLHGSPPGETTGELAGRIRTALELTDDYQRAMFPVIAEHHRPRPETGWRTVGTRAAVHQDDGWAREPMHLVLRSDHDDAAALIAVLAARSEPVRVHTVHIERGTAWLTPRDDAVQAMATDGLRRLGLAV